MTSDFKETEFETVDHFLRQLSQQDFLDIGLHQVAYIKPVKEKGTEDSLYYVHAADGSEISVMNTYDSALASIKVNDLHPVTVH
ncbi:MAG: DUF1150 family protein [Pseudomonadota bacterium]